MKHTNSSKVKEKKSKNKNNQAHNEDGAMSEMAYAWGGY